MRTGPLPCPQHSGGDGLSWFVGRLMSLGHLCHLSEQEWCERE